MGRGKIEIKNNTALLWTVGLLAVIVVLLIGTAFLAKSMSDSGHVLTYEDCTKQSGSRIQESYPEVCVSKDGKRFTNPDQKAGCTRAGYISNPENCR